MKEMDLFALSIKDFFTKEMIKIAFLPLIITLIVLYVVFFAMADVGLDTLQAHIEYSQNVNGVQTHEEFTYVGSGIVDFLLQYTVTSWIVAFLVYTIGSVIVAVFSVFIALIIIGFLTPMILEVLKKRRYQNVELTGHGDLFTTLYGTVKYFFIAFLMFIFLVPLYFIPIINIIAFNLPIFYLFHKLLNFDVTSTIMDKDELYFIRKGNKNKFRFRTMLLYFISLIPFISLFSAVFYIIYLGNGYFMELEKLRKEDNPLLRKD